MRRRDVLRVAAGTAVASVAGCTLPGDEEGVAAAVTHVYVLNRRSQACPFELEIEYDGDRILDRSREISGTESDSQPTALTFDDFPEQQGQYRFGFRVEDGEWLRATPAELNVTEAGATCVRVTFVINLDDRVTAYARQPCVEE
ncbi:hypothetical protein GJ631_05180 [Natronomonas sp. CBA1123]|uniref:hypothetical protein n=1 Tax=Natronomonas sp. CBA1123 TaxID=2668070 RepID=UPI0012EA1B5B|nr:hypothetical protein [Natronomonas sp. CBA1123]MUV85979.1 hypothetical protein [Natronomonas sp. CBA1123]